MTFPEEELPDVAEAAHTVVQEAKDSGVWVFGGGTPGGRRLDCASVLSLELKRGQRFCFSLPLRV